MAHCLILGGGVTGLAAGYASGAPVYEAREAPGGICSSYYVRPGETERHAARPSEPGGYRFEVGGGHWIFGGDPAVRRFLSALVPLKTYRRQSAVFFPEAGRYVPYPLQNHLHCLSSEEAARALSGLLAAPDGPARTMADWLAGHFGQPLMDLFFAPFHEAYTAGLWTKIAPQDAYKTPVDPEAVIEGAFEQAGVAGYNVDFRYPEGGLDVLARRLAGRCRMRYGKRAVQIDAQRKSVAFADGTEAGYDLLLSTLPLNATLSMAALALDEPPDPYTSVLVLNVGARRGPRCPDCHWLYVPRGKAGFHRVGFYSNVDTSFLPASSQGKERVSLYVERAYPGGARPSKAAQEAYVRQALRELKAWGYIEDVEVADCTWIDVAYTWSWPGSRWRQKALRRLHEHDILMVGRYGRWTFQGIADSVRDGLFVGSTLRL